MTAIQKIAELARALRLAIGTVLGAVPTLALAAGAHDVLPMMSASAAPAAMPAATGDSAIRPFRVAIPQAALDDLRKRLLATRLPDAETVSDRSQGAQLEQLQHGGAITIRSPSNSGFGGYIVEHIDWYRCVLPDTVLPANQDGEVQEFRLMAGGEVLERVLRREFTLEAALLLAEAGL